MSTLFDTASDPERAMTFHRDRPGSDGNAAELVSRRLAPLRHAERTRIHVASSNLANVQTGSPAPFVDAWAARFQGPGIDRLLIAKVCQALDLGASSGFATVEEAA